MTLTMTRTMTPSEARTILKRSVEDVGQFKLYLKQEKIANKFLEIVTEALTNTAVDSGSPAFFHNPGESAAMIIEHALSMPAISPFDSNPEENIAYGAPALQFLVEHARMLGEAVLPQLFIPSDKVVQAAMVVSNELQLARA